MKQQLIMSFQNYVTRSLVKQKQVKLNAPFLRTNHMILSFFYA